MVVTKKKKQKSSQELGVEILEQQKNEKIWDQYVEDLRKLCEIKFRQILQDTTKFQYEKIIAAAKFIEKLGICEQHQISTKVTHAVKGYINRSTVQVICKKENPKWLMKPRGASWPKGQSGRTASYNFEHENEEIQLAPHELEFLKAHEKELKRNQQIADIIESLTNKSITEQGEIVGKAHDSKTDFRKLLAEESHDYMTTVAKQMTDSDLEVNLWEHRTLRYLSERFSDILYEEKENRKRTEHLTSV